MSMGSVLIRMPPAVDPDNIVPPLPLSAGPAADVVASRKVAGHVKVVEDAVEVMARRTGSLSGSSYLIRGEGDGEAE